MAWLFGIVTVASLLALFVFVLLPVHIRTQLSLLVNMRILGAVFTIMGVTYVGNFVLIFQAIVEEEPAADHTILPKYALLMSVLLLQVSYVGFNIALL